MRNKTTAIFVTAFLLLCSLVQAQVETTVTRKKALLGVTNPLVQGNRILVGDDSNVSVSDVVLLEVRSDYKFQRVKARQNGNRIVIAGRDGLQDSVNQVGQEMTRRNMNIQPTLTARPGLPVRIIVARDLQVRPYQPLFLQRGGAR